MALPSATPMRPAAANAAPPSTKTGARRRPAIRRRSLSTPTAKGTVTPATAFTSSAVPISPGEFSIRSSSTGR